MMSFGTWVSSYYSHPYYTNPSPTRKRIVSSLQTRTPPAGTETKTSTLLTLLTAELRASVDSAPGVCSEQALIDLSIDLLSEIRRAALVTNASANVDAEKGKRSLPALKVWLVYATVSVWSVSWTAWSLVQEVERLRKFGMTVRDVATVCAEGANPFVS